MKLEKEYMGVKKEFYQLSFDVFWELSFPYVRFYMDKTFSKRSFTYPFWTSVDSSYVQNLSTNPSEVDHLTKMNKGTVNNYEDK